MILKRTVRLKDEYSIIFLSIFTSLEFSLAVLRQGSCVPVFLTISLRGCNEMSGPLFLIAFAIAEPGSRSRVHPSSQAMLEAGGSASKNLQHVRSTLTM